jgi:hypothetical protein
VTSYKDRRKTPYEAAAGSLRNLFESFCIARGCAHSLVHFYLISTFFSRNRRWVIVIVRFVVLTLPKFQESIDRA